ncbi:Uncharacterised protein [uncultured archaeon]|nr:Uncharacterised protein [uncultured archaeon]
MKLNASLTFDDFHPLAIKTERLRELLYLLNKYRLKSTIFLIPFYKEKNIGDNKEYVNLIKNYLDEGNEIGLHGYQHSENEFGWHLFNIPFPDFRTQLNKLNKSVKILEDTFHIKIHGFRSPEYKCNNYTIKALNKLKFEYDSSKTVFRPAHFPSYYMRFKTFIQPYPYIIGGNIENIVEIPVTGDYTYDLGPEDFNFCLKNLNNGIEFVTKKKGILVINNHMQRTQIDYDEYLKSLSNDKQLKFHTLNEICQRYQYF